MSNLYKFREGEHMFGLYFTHIQAINKEKPDNKTLASELAYRDMLIRKLYSQLETIITENYIDTEQYRESQDLLQEVANETSV